MKALVGAVILFGAVAQPATAQDMVYSFAPTTDCLAEKGPEGEAHQCFGTAANACMENTQGGWSTVGMSRCLGLELEDWDRRLNRAYGLLMTKLKAEDEEMAALGSSAPKQAPALREMQRGMDHVPRHRLRLRTLEMGWGHGRRSGCHVLPHVYDCPPSLVTGS